MTGCSVLRVCIIGHFERRKLLMLLLSRARYAGGARRRLLARPLVRTSALRHAVQRHPTALLFFPKLCLLFRLFDMGIAWTSSVQYSEDFEKEFLDVLSRRHGTKRVRATLVYNEFIANKTHTHMNSTQWETLTSFVLYLGKVSTFCNIDQSPRNFC